jgi:hypothetical protein
MLETDPLLLSELESLELSELDRLLLRLLLRLPELLDSELLSDELKDELSELEELLLELELELELEELLSLTDELDFDDPESDQSIESESIILPLLGMQIECGVR